jgi:uncharacterized protein (TIGR03382 family)
MNIFHRALAIAFLAAVPAAAQDVGDACTADSPPVCAGTSLLVCDGTETYATAADCAEVPGATCDVAECVGSQCPDTVTCSADRGGACVGIGTLFDGDSSNDNQLMAVPCEGDNACVANQTGETCQALPAGVDLCGVGDVDRCVGDKLVLCINYGSAQAVLPSPGILDCAAFNLTCGTDPSTDQIGCIEETDARCGAEGFGSCINNVANFCSDGTFTGSATDCSNSGQACVDDEGPRCVTAAPECGPTGVGVCDGNTATICADAQFVNTTDCSAIGRRCGADANGQIACITAGGGEGEGEGEPECDSDSDCEDDETCDDGECRRERTRSTTDNEEPAAGLFGCNTAGGVMFPMAAVVAVLLRRRRRA